MVVPVAHQCRAPAQLVQNIVETDALTRAERLGVCQDRPDVLVSGDCVDAMGLEPHDGTEIPEGLVVPVRFGERLVGEQVGVVGADRSGLLIPRTPSKHRLDVPLDLGRIGRVDAGQQPALGGQHEDRGHCPGQQVVEVGGGQVPDFA